MFCRQHMPSLECCHSSIYSYLFSEIIFHLTKDSTYEISDLEVGQQYAIQMQALSASNKESSFTDLVFGTPRTNGSGNATLMCIS